MSEQIQMSAAESLAAAKVEAFAVGATKPVTVDPQATAISTSATGGDATPKADAATTASPTATGESITATPVAQNGTDGTSSNSGSPADPAERRLLALAKQEQRVREQQKRGSEELATQAATQKAKLDKADRLERAENAWKSDPLAALEALGWSADDVYAPAAIDKYLGKAKAPTPEELAERVVEAKLSAAEQRRKDAEVAAESAAVAETRTKYIAGARGQLRAEADKYPSLVRALGTGDVTPEEIADAGEAYWKHTGKTPEFSLILGFLETELSPKSKQDASQIEASKTQPKAPVSTSNVPPVQSRPMTREESLAQAKREAGLTV